MTNRGASMSSLLEKHSTRRRTWPFGLLALGALTALAGCGSPHSLGGSIGEAYDLSYDYIQIRKVGTSLVVEYIQELGGGEDKVLKLTVEGHLLRSPDGTRILLDSGLKIEGDLFHQVVRIERVSGQGTREWPDVEVGKVHLGGMEFESDPVGSASGSFELLFVNGRTLSGTFAGRIEVVDMS